MLLGCLQSHKGKRCANVRPDLPGNVWVVPQSKTSIGQDIIWVPTISQASVKLGTIKMSLDKLDPFIDCTCCNFWSSDSFIIVSLLLEGIFLLGYPCTYITTFILLTFWIKFHVCQDQNLTSILSFLPVFIHSFFLSFFNHCSDISLHSCFA